MVGLWWREPGAGLDKPGRLSDNVPAIGDSEMLIPDQIAGTGRPLGSDKFIAKVERIAGRLLRKQKPGPKKREK